MKKVITSVLVAAGLTAGASGVDLTYLKTIDVSTFSTGTTNANYIGSNPGAVAWNGSTLFVGGYNSSGATNPTAINTVSNAGNSPVYGATAFGSLNTPNSRGIAGLSVKGNQIGVGLDSGAGSGDSVRMFDTSGNLQWRIGTSAPDSTRRGMGSAFDPGFNGSGTNVGFAYLSTGSGRRHLMDSATGAYINGQNAGAIINFNPASTTWRDMAFDPATGDMYTRESNRVGKAIRNGDNSFTVVSGGQSVAIFTSVVASGIDNQNLAFVNSPNQGAFLILNDRSSAGGGQSFTGVVKAIDTNGNALALNLIGFTPGTGNGAYDFSYDASTNTLAISDFANRQVYLYGIPTPGALSVLGIAGLVAGRRRRA